MQWVKAEKTLFGWFLILAIDQLNEVKGAGTIRMASVGINQRWLTRFGRQSPHYTTRLRDLPIARVP